jgi:choline transport protein
MLSDMIVYAYSLYHPEFIPERWQIYICYLIISWSCCLIVMFGQRTLAFISRLGSFLIIAGFVIAVVVCAIMPSQTGSDYATNAVIWKEWNNMTGYSSNGFVFIAGMLNGAFAIGAIDCVTHIAEEIPEYVTLRSKYVHSYHLAYKNFVVRLEVSPKR